MGLKNLFKKFKGDTEHPKSDEPTIVGSDITNGYGLEGLDISAKDYEIRLNKINLRKEKVSKICLEKKIDDVKARVVVVMDKSGSMDYLYRNGSVQKYLERLIPLALQFDDDGELDVYLFDDSYQEVESMTKDNFFGYINRLRINDFGGTCYSPVLDKIYDKYSDTDKIATYVVFITDGACWGSDENRTENILKEMSDEPIFIQFVGIGDETKKFLSNLDEMEGRFIDNANFLEIDDIDSMSDDALYKGLLKEFPSYLKEAKSKGVLK